MKCKVLKQCIDSKGNFLASNSIKDIDEKSDEKLFDLGLVRKYDEELDKAVPLDNEGLKKELQALKAKVAELEAKDGDAELVAENEALKAKVAELEGFVEEAIASAKGTVPVGYEKAK